MPERDNSQFCSACNHHRLLHGPDGCEVRTMASGYEDFASMPKCGCMEFQDRKEENAGFQGGEVNGPV